MYYIKNLDTNRYYAGYCNGLCWKDHWSRCIHSPNYEYLQGVVDTLCDVHPCLKTEDLFIEWFEGE